WMVEGCLEWQRTGLQPPAIVCDATAAYLEAEDALGAWIDEACERDPQAEESLRTLYESWRQWAEGRGEFAGRMKRFSQKLDDGGYERSRTSGARGFVGLRIIPPQPHWLGS